MYISNFIGNIFLSVNFLDEKSYAGSSFVPFISFMLFFIGLIVAFIGFINMNSAKKEWQVFYDLKDKVSDVTKEKKKKSIIMGRVVLLVGIIMMISSFILM